MRSQIIRVTAPLRQRALAQPILPFRLHSTSSRAGSRVTSPAAKALRAAPTIPFLGALFSSKAAAEEMSYPDQRSEDQWRAVLSPGPLTLLLREIHIIPSY